MSETYSESAEGLQISHERAMRELRAHGHDTASAEVLADFYECCGERATYDAGDILRWLGY